MTEQVIIPDRAASYKPLRGGGAAAAAKHLHSASMEGGFNHVLQRQAAALAPGAEPQPAPAEDAPAEAGTDLPSAPPAESEMRPLHIHATVEALLAALPANGPPSSGGQEPLRAKDGDGTHDLPPWQGAAASLWRNADPMPGKPPEAPDPVAKSPASLAPVEDDPAAALIAASSEKPLVEKRAGPVSATVTGGSRERELPAQGETEDRKEETDAKDNPPRKEAASAGLRAGQEKMPAEQPAVNLIAAAAQPDRTAAAPARRILDQLAAPVMSAAQEITGREDAAPLRQLKIALRPDDLGTVNVMLRLRGDVLSVVIEASVPETAELLRKDQGVLDSLLKPLTGEGAIVDITILPPQADAAATPFEDSASGNQPQDFAGSRQGGALAERERSPTGKEERASQEGERTPAHETRPAAQRRLPGTLLL